MREIIGDVREIIGGVREIIGGVQKNCGEGAKRPITIARRWRREDLGEKGIIERDRAEVIRPRAHKEPNRRFPRPRN